MACLIGFPNGPDVHTEVLDDILMQYDLDNFWGSISRKANPEPDSIHTNLIHNPTIRHFQMVLAHTLFGKCENITIVSKEELIILFCVFQSRHINTVTFMLASLDIISQAVVKPILIRGLVTMIVVTIGL